MKRILSSIALLLAVNSQAFATWSIIAIDTKTGQIVIASATCVPQQAFAGFPAKGLKDVQAIIIPGRGVAAAQANVDRTRRLQQLIATEMKRGTVPSQIIEMLKADDQYHASRQYGIVDLEGRAAGYSGASNGQRSLDKQGKVPGTDVYFSIQGNILAGDDVVIGAAKAFVNAKGTLADRVMAAMEAADENGGDRRCNCNTPPDPPASCDSKTAHVAYLVVAEKNDKMGEGLNDGTYSLEIQVTDQDIKPEENDNPVKTLRMRYDQWVKAHAQKTRPASN
ncbi:MAG TPA: DUF1028 domain-containing protein [Blastocatellia bacterium]|nr:DUF1028 domain-containing protein [Blastocatellia bacterium]